MAPNIRSVRAAAEAVTAQLLTQLSDSQGAAVRAFTERAARSLEAAPPGRYSAVPGSAVELWNHTVRSSGVPAPILGAALLGSAISTAAPRLASRPLPPRIVEEFATQYERIVQSLEVPGEGLTLESDAYRKDLALALARLYPCCAQVTELHSGVPRSVAWAGNARQAGAFIGLAVRSGFRFSPYAEIHTHTPMLDGFNAAGWERCYELVTELLEANPTVLGVLGASWFYDPAIETISPRLSYLRQQPLQGGALFMRMGSTSSDIANATAKSDTRKQLYEQGRYQPTSYIMIWPRARLIDWARTR